MNELDRRLSEHGVLAITTAPTVEPIGLDEIKAHSRITIDDDDILIQELILAVRQATEQKYNLAFVTQTCTLSFRRFFPEIQFPIRPVQSITNIEYLSTLPTTYSVLASTIYLADLKWRPPRLILAPGASYPQLADDRPNSVVITFKAGYGDTADSVPPHVRRYLAIKVADVYEQRESFSANTMNKVDFVEGLIANERLWA